MFDRIRETNGKTIAVNIAKAVILIAFISVVAASWLSASLVKTDRERLDELAALISGDSADPVATGSIARRADTTRLDPCKVPPRR